MTLRIGATIGVPEVLRSLGADPVKILAEEGLDLSLFDDPNNLISYQARGRLIAHCVDRTGCPHFGLLVGEKAGLLSFGLLGLLAKYSPDVGSALQTIVHYFHLHVRGATVAFAVDSDLAVFEYQIYQQGVQGNSHVGEGAVAVLFNMLRDLCGSDWRPVEVRFAHRQPEDVTPYRQFFQTPLRFDTNQYSIVFSAKWLNHRLLDTCPELLQLLQQDINKLDMRRKGDFIEQVRSLLRTTLVTGHSSANKFAELLSMQRRTLDRHLSAKGTSYKKLADETRFEIARQLLDDSELAIFQIAFLLGYANQSAFTRAFRRWSSTTPSRYRDATN